MEIDNAAIKEGQKFLWALGDFPSVAAMIRPASEAMLDRIGLAEGDELLDVACGTGNLAIPAARRGARVTGVDITPSLLDVARADAEAAGLSIDFREGDAEALEFADDSFDIVTSIFGMIFAPRHEVAAAEMVRVCRPGGAVAITAWTPEGMNGELFNVVGKHMPPPPEGMPRPTDWGSESYVRETFGGAPDWTFATLDAEFVADSTEDFLAFCENKLSPLVAARSVLEPQDKYPPLRRDLLAHMERFNVATDGSYLGRAEYLLAVGRLP